MRIELTIPAVPVAQPRAKAASFGGHARVYETKYTGKGESRKLHPITAFKATVRQTAQAVYQGPPLRGPIKVDCVFVLPRETSKIWKTKAMPRYPHIVKPDLDNLNKAVLDALSGTVLSDDAIVWDEHLTK